MSELTDERDAREAEAMQKAQMLALKDFHVTPEQALYGTPEGYWARGFEAGWQARARDGVEPSHPTPPSVGGDTVAEQPDTSIAERARAYCIDHIRPASPSNWDDYEKHLTAFAQSELDRIKEKESENQNADIYSIQK